MGSGTLQLQPYIIQATNVKGEGKTGFINPLSSILVPNYRRLIIATQCRLVKIIIKQKAKEIPIIPRLGEKSSRASYNHH